MSSKPRSDLSRRLVRGCGWISLTLLALGALAGLSLYLLRPARIEACDPVAGVLPFCGFTHPEDLAVLPSGWVLVSEFSPAPSPPGALSAFHLEQGRVPLSSTADPEAQRGSADCPGAPGSALSPHGLGLRVGATTSELLVVNHGRERETIELFDVEDGKAERPPSIRWRGCIPLPEGKWANDVTPMPGDALAVTSMLPPPGSLASISRMLGQALFGSATGEVNVWSPSEGWTLHPGSELQMANGILGTAEGGVIFVSEWGADRVHRIDAAGGRRTAELDFRPDNLSLGRDGRVLVTGQGGRFLTMVGCGLVESGACAIPYRVVALDPDDMAAEVIIDDPSSVTGAASVALEVEGGILVGSFSGDRLAFHPRE